MFRLLHVAFWAAILFLALSFFGVSIEKVIESPAGQANLAYLTSLALAAWHWLIGVATGVRSQITAP